MNIHMYHCNVRRHLLTSDQPYWFQGDKQNNGIYDVHACFEYATNLEISNWDSNFYRNVLIFESLSAKPQFTVVTPARKRILFPFFVIGKHSTMAKPQVPVCLSVCWSYYYLEAAKVKFMNVQIKYSHHTYLR